SNFKTLDPFNRWISEGNYHWGLPKNSSQVISNMKTYEEVYRYIYENKGIVGDIPVQKIIRESKYILDKTPLYARDIYNIYLKLPKNIPIFMILKTYQQTLYSHVVKRKSKLSDAQHLLR